MSNKMPIGKYRKRLSERHGETFLEDFDAIFSGDITLSRLSIKHGISKMRATQIFVKLYGKTFREAKRDGGAMDSSGEFFPYEPGKTKQFMVIISRELDDEIVKQAKESNRSKAAFVRDCIIEYISKGDPLSTLSKGFGI